MSYRSQKLDIPRHSLALMRDIYRKVLPGVNRQLDYWTQKAKVIPNEELRTQALASISSKRFHCEGGAIYALLAVNEHRHDVIQFIVAYQTISDYLDNLCDRSVSTDGHNFRRLHQSMPDALTGQLTYDNYYALQEDQDDGGYLTELVKACHDALAKLPGTESYQAHMLTLCQLYCDLQVYKHITEDKREQALLDWWAEHQDSFAELEWYEFAAATGSTLGIFYYTALSSHEYSDTELERQVFEAYFPYVQGIHILLDYFIDQEEDRQENDLNFCFYYASEAEKLHRLDWFVQKAKSGVSKLPHAKFHQMVIEGLLGIYLSQEKVKHQPDVKLITKRLLKKSRLSTWFFYLNAIYLHFKGKKKKKSL